MDADEQAATLYSWRFQSLWATGYDSASAELLALSKADLHQMVEAKEGGCSDAQALAIFT